MAKWKRKCPKCGKEIPYTRKTERDRAEKRNTNCLSCAKKGESHYFYGKKRSEETKKKMRENNSHYWTGKTRTEETKQKISESLRGIKHSEESNKKRRLTALKNIEDRCGQVIPNYNTKAISSIRVKAKELGITDLQDAETLGGEFQVCGYFVDGRSEEKNIVIEYYEPFHKRQKGRDERRKNEIIKELGCKFIEIWE